MRATSDILDIATLAQEHCGAIRHGYRCTRAPGHVGEHVSYGQVGQVVRWPDE